MSCRVVSYLVLSHYANSLSLSLSLPFPPSFSSSSSFFLSFFLCSCSCSCSPALLECPHIQFNPIQLHSLRLHNRRNTIPVAHSCKNDDLSSLASTSSPGDHDLPLLIHKDLFRSWFHEKEIVRLCEVRQDRQH